MKKNLNLLPLVFVYFFLSLLIFSCAKDEEIRSEEDPTTITFPEPTEIITTSLYGRVVDIENNPIVGAKVTCVSCSTLQVISSDSTGNFLFKDIQNKGTSAFVTVENSDMFKGFRRFGVLPDRIQYTEIQMNKKIQIGELNSKVGGTLTSTDGSAVTLPANGIIDVNGNPYTGVVKVYIPWINPSSDNLSQNMIGDLSGVDNEGELMSLITFGMLVIELTDQDGNELNLLEDNEAELKFPIPADKISVAPETIALWHYDEENGYWVEESSADKEGNFYVGVVGHFSSWNVDQKVEGINVTGSVILGNNDENVPLPYFEVIVCSPNIGQIGGWLCDDGSFVFYNFPTDEAFEIKVKDYCGNIVYQENYEAQSEDVDLGAIVLNPNGVSTISFEGNAINCDLEPLENGLLVFEIGSRKFMLDIQDDGSFNIPVTVCDDFSVNFIITDLDNLSISENIQITDSDTDFKYPNIVVCDEIDDFFYINVAGSHEELIIDDGSNILLVSNSEVLHFTVHSDLERFLGNQNFLFNTVDIEENQILKVSETETNLFFLYLIEDFPGSLPSFHNSEGENLEFVFTKIEKEYIGTTYLVKEAHGYISGYFIEDGKRFDVNISFKISQ